MGETTILYQVMDELLKDGVNRLNTLYFTMDYGVTQLVEFLNSYSSVTGINGKWDKVFVFLDEVHLLKDWASQVKLLYDSFPNLKIVLSGSASLQPEAEAMEKLASRHFLLEIPAPSLTEYYSLKHGVHIVEPLLYEADMSIELDSYIAKPLPELVNVEEKLRVPG